MPPSHRKKPFSGKAKKQQLQEKKARKAAAVEAKREEEQEKEELPDLKQSFVPATKSVFAPQVSQQPSQSKRLVSMFERLTPEAIEKSRLASMRPFERLPQTALEIGVDSFAESIDFPKRPKWDYTMSKEKIDTQETRYFHEWVRSIYAKYGDQQELSWFERNLEVWRQLWRVLEMSDIILVVMDIRHPLLHFPRALYDYVTRDLKRKIVGVFNKVDLVSEFTVYAWRKYFEEHFPELHIACFSCYPRDQKLIDDTKTYALKERARRPRRRYYHAHGVRAILKACSEVNLEKPGVTVDWEALMSRYDQEQERSEEETFHSSDEEDDDSDTGSMEGLDDDFRRAMDLSSQDVTPHKNYVTLGLVGHPNVGKSSLINSIMRKTVVSASQTPGHTKHFQTIHLSENVRLCDSPGLVFPSLLPRTLQILSGMYPIAQVQEPYSVVQYLAERVPVEKIMSLEPPDLEESASFRWSAWAICESYAIQRGFYTAQAARPDVYRAANTILRLTCDGRILMSFKPSGFFTTTKYEKLAVQESKRSSHKSSDDDDDDEEAEEDEGVGYEIQMGGAFAALADDQS